MPLQATALLSSAQALALGIGLVCGATVLLSAPGLLGLLGCSEALVQPAAEYLRIRAVGMPLLLFNAVTTSGLLAQKDVIPALAACIGSIMSLAVVEAGLVGWLGLGLSGSAASVVVFQVVQGLALTYWLRRRNTIVPK